MDKIDEAMTEIQDWADSAVEVATREQSISRWFKAMELMRNHGKLILACMAVARDAMNDDFGIEYHSGTDVWQCTGCGRNDEDATDIPHKAGCSYAALQEIIDE